MIWVFIAQGSVTAAIGIAAGWCARGVWDHAGRQVDELTATPHRPGEPVSELEWRRIVQQIKEDR